MFKLCTCSNCGSWWYNISCDYCPSRCMHNELYFVSWGHWVQFLYELLQLTGRVDYRILPSAVSECGVALLVLLPEGRISLPSKSAKKNNRGIDCAPPFYIWRVRACVRACARARVCSPTISHYSSPKHLNGCWWNFVVVFSSYYYSSYSSIGTTSLGGTWLSHWVFASPFLTLH